MHGWMDFFNAIEPLMTLFSASKKVRMALEHTVSVQLVGDVFRKNRAKSHMSLGAIGMLKGC